MTDSCSSVSEHCVDPVVQFQRWLKINFVILVIDLISVLLTHTDQAFIWGPILCFGILTTLVGWNYSRHVRKNKHTRVICELIIATIHILHFFNLVYLCICAGEFLLWHHILMLFKESLSKEKFMHVCLEIFSDVYDICLFFNTLRELYELATEFCCESDRDAQYIYPNRVVTVQLTEIDTECRKCSNLNT